MLPYVPSNLNLHGHPSLEDHFVAVILHDHPVQIADEVRTSAAYKLYGEWCDKYGYRKENSTNFNNAIQRFFPIQRKRPNGESGGPTTMLIGCRFPEKENGEPEEENAAFS